MGSIDGVNYPEGNGLLAYCLTKRTSKPAKSSMGWLYDIFDVFKMENFKFTVIRKLLKSLKKY